MLDERDHELDALTDRHIEQAVDVGLQLGDVEAIALKRASFDKPDAEENGRRPGASSTGLRSVGSRGLFDIVNEIDA